MSRLALALVVAICTIGSTAADNGASWAAIADPVFVHVDARELPDTYVDALAQDATGFVWVGTAGGLARFDGYRFKNFLPNPSDSRALPEGYVRTLLAGDRGMLWMGSGSSGLIGLDEATETFRTWRADARDRTGPRSATVIALVPTGDGRIWIGGDGGLDRFDPVSGTFEAFAVSRAARQPAIGSILVARDGSIWVGSTQGLFYRAPHGDAFVPILTPGGAVIQVATLYGDSQGRVWVGSSDTVRIYRQAQPFATIPVTGMQLSLLEVKPGTVWSASLAGGIAVLDLANGVRRRITADRINPGGFAQGPTVQLMRDRSGLVWVANGDGGLLFYNPNPVGFYAISASRPATATSVGGATAVASGLDGRLWSGGLDGKLVALDPQRGIVRKFVLPTRAEILRLAVAPNGDLWIATSTGLCRLRFASDTAVRCPDGPAALAHIGSQALLDDGTSLWVGTGAGLYQVDERTQRVVVYRQGDGPGSLSNDSVMSIFRDREGKVWAGTFNGLNRILPVTHRVTRFIFNPAKASSVGIGFIDAMLEDRRGRIWAGAVGGPLNVVEQRPDGSIRVQHVDRAQGMPHQNVDGLEQDAAGTIWASTNAGLATIDPETLHARALGWIDGVFGGDYWNGSSAKAADGTLFFGSVDGISVAAPGARSPWTYRAPVVITDLEIDRKSVPAWNLNHATTPVTLPAHDRDVTIEFASLDYSAPLSLRYAYALEPFDSAFVDAPATRRVASYTNLSPGSYRFRVRGTNRLGVWNAAPLLAIVAQPSWYETTWFRISVVALALLIVWGASQIRTYYLRRRQRELEHVVADRTRALSDANEKLAELSLTDPLTGLRNRRFLESCIDGDAALAMRLGPGADLLFFLVDIDHFKAVNDRFGHHAGDRVLVQMRERLQRVFRESDYIVRWGGEEFLMVTRGSKRDDALDLAERVRTEVANQPFALSAGENVAIAVSVGVAAFPFVPEFPAAISWSQTIDLADLALYAAKQRGRNRSALLVATAATDPLRLALALDSGIDAVQAGSLELRSPADAGEWSLR